MSEVTQVGFVSRELKDSDNDVPEDTESMPDLPPATEVFEIHGPFFFGAADRFKDSMRAMKRPPKALILRMRHVPAIDATGMMALEDVLAKCRREGTTLVLSGVASQPRRALERSGLLDRIGAENVLPVFDLAIARVRSLMKIEV